MLYHKNTDFLNNKYLKSLYTKFGGTIDNSYKSSKSSTNKLTFFVGGETAEGFINELLKRLNSPYSSKPTPKTKTKLFNLDATFEDIQIPGYEKSDNLFVTIKNFIKFIQKSFYSNPTILKLNCLNFDNFEKLYERTTDTKIKNCMKEFILFATIDIYDIENLNKINKIDSETTKYINASKHIKTKIIGSKNIDEKYKKYIENINKEGIYIHTLNFLKVMTTIRNEDNFNKLINNYPKVINIMINFMKMKIEQYNSIEDCFSVTNKKNTFSPFIPNLDEIIKHQNEANVVTYLKLSNQTNEPYNKKRFEIEYTESEPFLMKVNYNYSNKNIEDPSVIDNSREKYIVGGLTKIFLPKQSNSEIATQLQTVIDKAKQGNPIMMIGYGISGAGKTSTLIYLNQPNLPNDTKNGIVLHICNNLGINDGYTKLNMTVNEFYNVCKEYPNTLGCKQRDTISFDFEQKKKEWMLNKGTIFPKTHLYRQAGKPTDYENIKTLGECLVYVIDTDRLVNPTTNNPNSSRSHSVIELEIIPKKETYKTKTVYFYIGDFAGVENAFDCKNTEVLKKFMTIGEKVDEKGNITEDSIYKKKYKEWYSNKDKDPEHYKSLDQLDGGGRTRNRKNKTRKNKKKGGVFEQKGGPGPQYGKDTKWPTPLTKNQSTVISVNKTRKNQQLFNSVPSEKTREKTDAKAEADKAAAEATAKATAKAIAEKVSKYPINETKLFNETTLNEKTISPEFLDYPIDKIRDEPTAIIEYSKIQQNIETNPTIKNIQSKINNINNMISEFEKIRFDYDSTKLNNLKDLMNDSNKINTIYTTINKTKENLKTLPSGILSRTSIESIEKFNFFDQTDSQITELKDIIKTKINKSEMKPVYSTFLSKLNNVLKVEPKKNELGDWTIKNIVDKINLSNDTNRNIIDNNKYLNLGIDDFNMYIKGSTVFEEIYCQVNRSSGLCPDLKTYTLSIKRWINEHLIFIFLFSTDTIKLYLENLLKEQQNNLKSQSKGDPDEFIKNVNYLKYADFICKRRLEEGKYINDTLRKLREDIKNITVVKNESTLYYSPDFAYDCLEDYCISQNDCFSMKSSSQILDFTCPMINWVYERLNTHKGYNKQSNGETDPKRQFAKEIIFSIFAVMNITKDRNEPPPIPYVDINELKKYSDNFNPTYLIDNNTKYMNKYAIMMCVNALYITFMFLHYYNLTEILSSPAYKKIYGENSKPDKIDNLEQSIIDQKQYLKQIITDRKEIYANIDSIESADTYNFDWNNFKSDASIFKYTDGSIIHQLLNFKYEDINNVMKYNDFEINIQTIQTFANMIDSNNASSTIGTLEFIDQFSKLNTTSVLCKTDETSVYELIDK